MLLDRGRVAKDGGIHRHKTVTGAALAAHVYVTGRRTLRKYGAENFTQHPVAVALVAAQRFRVAAQRHDAAAVLGDDVLQHVFRIGGRMSVLVQRPALGQRLAHLVVHFQLAAGDHSGGRVKEKGIGLGGHRQRDGVGADHGHTGISGHHNGLAVGHGHADQPLIAGHFGIVTGNAEMVGIADGHDGHAGLLRLCDGQLHGLMAHQLTHGVVRVDYGGNRRFVDDFGLGVNVDHALLNALVIAHQALHAVALDAVQVRQQQHVADDPGFAFAETKLLERIHAEGVQLVIGIVQVFGSHGNPLLLS